MRRFNNSELLKFRTLGRSNFTVFFIVLKSVFFKLSYELSKCKQNVDIQSVGISSHSKRLDQERLSQDFFHEVGVDAIVTYKYQFSFNVILWISNLYRLFYFGKAGIIDNIRSSINNKITLNSDITLCLFNEAILEVYLFAEITPCKTICCGQHAIYPAYKEGDVSSVVYDFSYSNIYLIRNEQVLNHYKYVFLIQRYNESIQFQTSIYSEWVLPSSLIDGAESNVSYDVLFLSAPENRSQNFKAIKKISNKSKCLRLVIHPSDSKFRYLRFIHLFDDYVFIGNIRKAYSFGGTISNVLEGKGVNIEVLPFK